MLVGAFVIFNTFSITVAQRTRELALLRTLGAGRRQVLSSVVLEAALIGVTAAAIGVAAGVGVAAGLFALFAAVGATLPKVGLVVDSGTLVPGLVLGIVVTLVASIVPAVRATRISPTTALRESAGAERKPGKGSLIASFVLLGIAAAALGYGVLGNPSSANTRLLLIAIGSLALILGTAASASRLVGPIVMIAGAPLRRFAGLPGTLASENARRNPGRTATTSAALMIGVAVVAFIAIIAHAVTSANNGELTKHVTAAYVVQASAEGASLDSALAARVKGVPGVSTVTAISREVTRVNGGQAHLAFGVDPSTLLSGYRFTWKQGSDATLAKLGAHDALMPANIAKDEHLKVGQTFSVETPSGGKAKFRLRGTYDDELYLRGYVIRESSWQSLFKSTDDSMIFAGLQSGSSKTATEAAIRARIADHHGVKVQNHDEIRAANAQDSQNIVTLVDAMLALSLIISLFGIVNTLVLSILERTREIGLMRAIGASRRQVRRSVRYEGVLTAYVGGVLGRRPGRRGRGPRRARGRWADVLDPGRSADPARLGVHDRRHPRRCAARAPRVAARRARRARPRLRGGARRNAGPEARSLRARGAHVGDLVQQALAQLVRSAPARTRSGRSARRRGSRALRAPGCASRAARARRTRSRRSAAAPRSRWTLRQRNATCASR